jgi:uncharacterized protein YndB with AHSA1/START domain
MIDNTAFGELGADGTLRFERLLPGPIERVWDYLTKPELLATWIAPFAIPATPGTAFQHVWNAESRFEGRVRIYDPPHTLAYDWNEATAPGGPIIDTILRFDLAADGDRVRLVLTHRVLPAHARISVGAGWHAHLDALIAHASAAAPIDPTARYHAVAPAYHEYFGAAT